MILWARQLGFLHSKPKDQPDTRMKQIERAGGNLGLPELPELEYLPSVFFDLGPTRATGMSESATDWDVILPYGQVSGLDEDDMTTLAAMFKGYLSARISGENLLAIPPVEQGDGEDDE